MLPDFDLSAHPPNQPTVRIWLGRPKDRLNEGKTPDWLYPDEPIPEMGCPGAWYRTPFCRSLDRYYRRRDEHGNRIDRPALTQCTDTLVLEAIEVLESYEDAAHVQYLRNYYAEQDAKRKAKT